MPHRAPGCSPRRRQRWRGDGSPPWLHKRGNPPPLTPLLPAARPQSAVRNWCTGTRTTASRLPPTPSPQGIPQVGRDSVGKRLIGCNDGGAAPAPPEQRPSRGNRLQPSAAAAAVACLGGDAGTAHLSSSPLGGAPHPGRVFSSRGGRLPAGLGTAQVGTPNRGSTTHCSSPQITITPTSASSSPPLTSPPRSPPPAPGRSPHARR